MTLEHTYFNDNYHDSSIRAAVASVKGKGNFIMKIGLKVLIYH